MIASIFGEIVINVDLLRASVGTVARDENYLLRSFSPFLAVEMIQNNVTYFSDYKLGFDW
jgi:hypothetical protein